MTNIKDHHRKVFDALTEGGHGFALFSCFYDGQPAVAIVAVMHAGLDDITIKPVALFLDSDDLARRLRDHDGTPAISESGVPVIMKCEGAA